LGHEGLPPSEKQVTGGHGGGGVGIQDASGLQRVERSPVDSLYLGPTSHKEHEVPPVGQKLREAVTRVPPIPIEAGQRQWLPARGGDPVEGTAGGAKDDHAIPAPGSAHSSSHARQGLRRPALDIDASESAPGEKRDRAAVRRPEGIGRPFRARERLSRFRLQGTEPEP
jgi:hypothetical protein